MNKDGLRLAKVLTTAKKADRFAKKGYVIENVELDKTGRFYFFVYETEEIRRRNKVNRQRHETLKELSGKEGDT